MNYVGNAGIARISRSAGRDPRQALQLSALRHWWTKIPQAARRRDASGELPFEAHLGGVLRYLESP